MVHLFQPVVQKTTETQKFYLSLQLLVWTERREKSPGKSKGGWRQQRGPELPRKQKERMKCYSGKFYHYSYMVVPKNHNQGSMPCCDKFLETLLLTAVSPPDFIWYIFTVMIITLQCTHHLPGNTKEALYGISALQYFGIICNISQ